MLQHGLGQTELSVKDVSKQDPLNFILYLNAAILLLTSIHIWILSNIDLWNFFQKVTPPPKLKTLKTNKLGYFQETENIYIGVSQTLLAITIIVVLLVPSYISRRYFEKNSYGVNFGAGQAWIYIGRITMPFLSFVILPCILIVNNPKMRKALIRKLRDIILSLNHN
jgi:hypothetical protein